jgi:small-conductance mechanosensitive channel
MLEELGLKLNALLAGSAALLVGIGLGLQNTFNNFVSGIILLFEGSIHVGDVLEIDDDVVQIEKISLRTSRRSVCGHRKRSTVTISRSSFPTPSSPPTKLSTGATRTVKHGFASRWG